MIVVGKVNFGVLNPFFSVRYFSLKNVLLWRFPRWDPKAPATVWLLEQRGAGLAAGVRWGLRAKTAPGTRRTAFLTAHSPFPIAELFSIAAAKSDSVSGA